MPCFGDVVPRGVDLLLPVERQMIAALRDDDLREQSWREYTALLQGVQRGNDGRLVHIIALYILAADDKAAQELNWLIVELLGNFLADVPPDCGCCGDFLDRFK